jgi:hypothetical protein
LCCHDEETGREKDEDKKWFLRNSIIQQQQWNRSLVIVCNNTAMSMHLPFPLANFLLLFVIFCITLLHVITQILRFCSFMCFSRFGYVT